jgi:hypothetical protein
MVQSSEFGEAMTIGAVSWEPVQGMGDMVNFDSFSIDMGLCGTDALEPVFDLNYINGTKTRVFERASSFSVNAVYPWTTIVLDTPYFYDPVAGNLLVEVNWPNGDSQIYTYDFPTEAASMVSGAYGDGAGYLFTQAPHMLLEGGFALGQSTFAGIKATFR